MKMKVKGYNVYYAPDGQDEEFCGFAASKREARKLAAKGDRLPKNLWDTARAAGHVYGMSPPSGIEAEEPCEWFGRGGNYCMVPVLSAHRVRT